MMTARIAGIGAYVPENLITNDDLAKIVDTDRNPGTPDLLRRGNAPSGGEGS